MPSPADVERLKELMNLNERQLMLALFHDEVRGASLHDQLRLAGEKWSALRDDVVRVICGSASVRAVCQQDGDKLALACTVLDAICESALPTMLPQSPVTIAALATKLGLNMLCKDLWKSS